jgi:hypothetical protein
VGSVMFVGFEKVLRRRDLGFFDVDRFRIPLSRMISQAQRCQPELQKRGAPQNQ